MTNLVAIQMQGLDFHTHGRASGRTFFQRDAHGVFGCGVDRIHGFTDLFGKCLGLCIHHVYSPLNAGARFCKNALTPSM